MPKSKPRKVLESITSDRYRPVGALAPGGPVASRAMKRRRMVIRNTLTRAEPGTWSAGVAEVSALARVAGLVYVLLVVVATRIGATVRAGRLGLVPASCGGGAAGIWTRPAPRSAPHGAVAPLHGAARAAHPPQAGAAADGRPCGALSRHSPRESQGHLASGTEGGARGRVRGASRSRVHMGLQSYAQRRCRPLLLTGYTSASSRSMRPSTAGGGIAYQGRRCSAGR